ncbi:MAG: hypothetical protein JWQ99_315 [Blastococcus sp.]|nr:hypothetical protein [Blastococcus sp.]
MTASGAPRELDIYDIAFLAGGPARVVDTAVVALLRTRRLRLQSPGHLVTADLSRRHPVEAAVLDAVGPTGHRSVDTIRRRVLDDERLLEVERRLQPGTGDPEVRQVAVGGREQLTDQRLRAEIFDVPTTALEPARPGHRSRGIDHSDPRLAAYRSGGGADKAGVVFGFLGGGP